jgi:hypothetical protein
VLASDKMPASLPATQTMDLKSGSLVIVVADDCNYGTRVGNGNHRTLTLSSSSLQEKASGAGPRMRPHRAAMLR